MPSNRVPPDPQTASRPGGPLRWLPWLVFFAVLLAVGRYWHSGQMGFYEDDYTLVTPAMASSWPEVRQFVWSLLSTFGGQGRPLQHSLVYLLSWLAGRAGGLPQAYWLGWGILTLNTTLAWLLLRRLFPAAAALAGALAFALFGADTTQAFLYHSFGLQQALTFLLVALHLYLSERRALSYLVILGSLLSYETVFPVFLAAPILGDRTGRALRREFGRHLAVLAGLFLGVLLLRAATGEQRVSDLGFPEIVVTPLLHMLQGPAVSLGTFAYRPIQVAQSLDGELTALMLVSGLAILFAFRAAGWAGNPAGDQLVTALRRRSTRDLGEAGRRLMRRCAAGLAMLVLAYPLTFTIRAYAISGRDTRVHLAAVLGAAIVWACLAQLLFGHSGAMRRQRAVGLALSGYFAILVGFGLVVQRSYVRAWEVQRAFWADVLRLCPDLEPGLVVLVEPDGLEDPRFIYANHWNLPRVLPQILRFPAEWERPPRVFRLTDGWESNLVTDDGLIRLDASTVVAPPSLYGQAAPSQVILLETAVSGLARLGDEIQLSGVPVRFRGAAGLPAPAVEAGPLYGELIGGSDVGSGS